MKTPAERQRDYRERKGANVGAQRPGPPRTSPHGTRRRYLNHLADGDPPCDDCNAANAKATADWRARK